MTGKPISRAMPIASSTSVRMPSLPGTMGRPAAFIVRLASALSPMRRIISGLGPMNVNLARLAHLDEVRVLRQEPIARVDGVGAVTPAAEISRAMVCRTAPALGGLMHTDSSASRTCRLAVGLAEHGHRGDVQLRGRRG